jgi:GTP-binding protein Era
MKKHSGFVAIVGKPNVGKSTLLNRLVGEKLAGVSPKPQTTRNVVRGILTRPKGQIVFLDTPGLHEPRDLLGNWMVREIEKSMAEVDLLYWMVLPEEPRPQDEKILEVLRKRAAARPIPIFLIVNQVDRFPKPHILPVLDHYQKAFSFRELIPISAKVGDQVDLLIKKTFEHLPEAEPFFPEDQISDQQERFIVAEMIREKVYLMTGEEIPYATAVVMDSFEEKSATLVHIQATIIVEKDSQKGMMIGKGGRMLKRIGQAARIDIERFLSKKVYLRLWVKTLGNWKKDQGALKRLGYL